MINYCVFLDIYIYIYMYVYMYVYIYVYIYIYNNFIIYFILYNVTSIFVRDASQHTCCITITIYKKCHFIQ